MKLCERCGQAIRTQKFRRYCTEDCFRKATKWRTPHLSIHHFSFDVGRKWPRLPFDYFDFDSREDN